jgi:ribosomal protein L5
MARLQQHYREKIAKDLTEKFGYKSPMQVPRLTKITLNMGVGEAVADKKVLDNAKTSPSAAWSRCVACRCMSSWTVS